MELRLISMVDHVQAQRVVFMTPLRAGPVLLVCSNERKAGVDDVFQVVGGFPVFVSRRE